MYKSVEYYFKEEHLAKGQNRNNISRNYMKDPGRFAQICNNTLFEG